MVVFHSPLVTDFTESEKLLCLPYSFCKGSMCYAWLHISLHKEMWNKSILVVYYDIACTVVTLASVIILHFHTLS